MTTYAINTTIVDGYIVNRQTFMGTLVMTTPSVGGGTTTTTTGGSGGGSPTGAVGRLWPDGSGTVTASVG